MTHLSRCIAACLLVAACSSDPAAPEADAMVADVAVADVPADLGAPSDTPVAVDAPVAIDAPGEVDASAPAYPDGPYGNRMGSVLANLTWQGYVNPTGEAISNTLPYTTTSLQALRGSGRGYAMVHVSEFL
ncbi:MAG: hypothetical protein Q8S73_18620 [Deltaproteobacteria bacterium]|nr:hypothetical protein [Myxococcales bacterium]MDP3216128.1 hypothetical protein [Deltaproteobacteria bacterium]